MLRSDPGTRESMFPRARWHDKTFANPPGEAQTWPLEWLSFHESAPLLKCLP
jgi:hypothetical protein